MDTERYQALMDAATVLRSAIYRMYTEDGDDSSPAFSLMAHARGYLLRQADEVFRAEVSA